MSKVNFLIYNSIDCNSTFSIDGWMKKIQRLHKYISSFDSIEYILSHATKMQLFWSQLRANDVLPRVLIFDYCYYYFEII
jgi:hypothetical protein